MPSRKRLSLFQRSRLLQLRELAPEEFAFFLIELGELALLRRKVRRASLSAHKPNA